MIMVRIMTKICLIIPDIPPSNNKYQGRGSQKEHIIDYQEEKTKWGWLVRAHINKKPKKPFERAIVKITYYFPDKRRRDPDNYSGKFILDGLVDSNIIADDSFFNIKLILDAKTDRDKPRTMVEVWDRT